MATTSARTLVLAAFLAPIVGWFTLLTLLMIALLDRRAVAEAASVLRVDRRAAVLLAIAAAFLAVVIGANALHGDAVEAWRSLRFGLPLLLPFLALGLIRSFRFGPAELSRWSGRAVIVAFVALLLEQLITHFMWPEAHGIRARALSANPLFVSSMLLPLIFLAWLAPESASPGGLPWRFGVSVLGFVSVAALTASRASTIAYVLMLGPLLLYLWREGRLGRTVSARNMLLAAAGVLMALVVAAVLTDLPPSRFRSLIAYFSNPADYGQDPSIHLRLVHWKAAWLAFLDSPLRGYGFENESLAIRPFLPAEIDVLSTAHQQYLSFALGGGVLGLGAGLAFLSLPLVASLLAGGLTARAVYAGCCVFVPFLINGFTDTQFDDLRILTYYLLYSLLLYVALRQASPAAAAGRPA